MPTILICRICGNRGAAELAANQQELAAVGLLEQGCDQCGRATFWQVAENVRRQERRNSERRATERRRRSVPVAAERRAVTIRRVLPRRTRERRARA